MVRTVFNVSIIVVVGFGATVMVVVIKASVFSC